MDSKTNRRYVPKFYVSPLQVMPELKKHLLVDGFDFVMDLENSLGQLFCDARSGDMYLDFFTCFASMPIGINHPKLVEKSFRDYLSRIALNKPSNSDIYTEAMATFVKTLFSVAMPEYFKYLFLIEGGALAVENALKTAFDWKVRQNFRKGYTTDRGHKIIHFRQAFHGRSGYTMSLTNTDPAKILYYPKFDWPRVINPKITFPLAGQNLDRVIDLEKQAIEQIKQAFSGNKDDIAAIIIEPIQGEGGDNHFRREFLAELRRHADENESLLIFDEIQAGVGITGRWWAHEHFGVKPDIMVFGKKMQVCGFVATDTLDSVPDNVFHVSSRINSTWGGNLTDMARATRYLEIIEEENLVENAATVGNKLITKLNQLAVKYPDIVTQVRGRGLFCAFDMPELEMRRRFISKCFDSKLLILPCGERSVRFRPALNITEAHIDEGFAIIDKVLASVASF